jgi:hypothetical protein
MSKIKVELRSGTRRIAVWEGNEGPLDLAVYVDGEPQLNLRLSNTSSNRSEGDDFTLPLPETTGKWDETDPLGESGVPTRIEGDDFTMPFPLSDPTAVRDDFTASSIHSVDLLSVSMNVDFDGLSVEDTSVRSSSKQRAHLIDRLRQLDEDFEDALPHLEKSVVERVNPMEIWRFVHGQWHQSGYLRPGSTAQAFSARVNLESSGSILISGSTVARVSALHKDGREEFINLTDGPTTLPRGLAVMMRCQNEAFCIRPLEEEA